MRNNHSIEQAFIEAVNNYIAAVNEDMIAYGLEESALWPFVSPIGEAYADDELAHRLQAYQFPDNTPHRHLFFLKEFKEHHQYIAFGENSNYNSTYVIEKATGRILVFSEHGDFLANCAKDLPSFLKAFTVMVNLEIAHIQKQEIVSPLAVLDEAVVVAGGEEYRTYYKVIFPINIEEVLN